MKAVQQIALRMIAAALGIGTIAGAYLLGYRIGYEEALNEWSVQPAVVWMPAQQASRDSTETKP